MNMDSEMMQLVTELERETGMDPREPLFAALFVARRIDQAKEEILEVIDSLRNGGGEIS